MEKRGEEKKLAMLEGEPCTSFRDPALAQDHALLATPERFTDDRPFLETDAFHLCPAKLACGRCPSTSTSTHTRSFPETACRAPRTTSPRLARRDSAVSRSPITIPATRSPIFWIKA